ncbi:MAG: bifunctional pyr operon transcriptional regulator/uracil phosphoribosyltransferase PyrR [Phycisphaerales bacterium]|nr:bifunctional pyr operon transcriptional regulator/uracil phosphoribosyltransferase PyrR [Phycisphaerales bacterium]
MYPVADAARIDQLLDSLAEQIRRTGADRNRPALIGIRRRGDVIAQRLGKKLGVADVGSIDITLYRDDLSETGAAARVGGTSIPFDIAGRDVILCDDVIMTGRSILAALREILDFGRPARIHLCVLVERPEREIPIQPEFIGLKLRPQPGEKIDVRLSPTDESDRITINPRA